MASELSVLEARNSYESLRPAYTNIKTAYETQLMAFKKMLSIDLAQDIDVEGSLDVSPLDLDADKLIDTFMMNRFDIQLAMKTMDVKENILSMTKSRKSDSFTDFKRQLEQQCRGCRRSGLD